MAKKGNFEASMLELEKTVKQLEAGDLPIDSALELFEGGVKLYKECHQMLNQAEQRVINALSSAQMELGDVKKD